MRGSCGSIISDPAGPVPHPSMRDRPVGDITGKLDLVGHHHHGLVLAGELLHQANTSSTHSGSRAEVGSSNRITLVGRHGPADTDCCWPPERRRVGILFLGEADVAVRMPRAWHDLRLRLLQTVISPSAMLSSAVLLANRA